MSESFSRSDKRANDALLVLFAERLDISFILPTQHVLAAVNPGRFEFGSDGLVRPAFPEDCPQVVVEFFQSWTVEEPGTRSRCAIYR